MSEKKLTVTCPECKGRLIVWDDFEDYYVRCEYCRGAGEVAPGADKVTCPECKGVDDGFDCWRCGSWGTVRADDIVPPEKAI